MRLLFEYDGGDRWRTEPSDERRAQVAIATHLPVVRVDEHSTLELNCGLG